MIFAVLLLATRFSETIVVTAERMEQPWSESSAAITVLRHEDLAQLPAQNLGDALRLVPGMQLIVVNPGAPPMISSRGFFGGGEIEYVQLLVDGVPTGDVESGLADWRSIPIESIDRIEIVRGAGSSLFGDTALGGVVQVFRRATPQVSYSVGGFNTERFVASYSGATLGHVESGGFREHSASDEWFGAFAHDLGKFHASIDASKRDREDPGPLGESALFQDDREENRRLRGALKYRGSFDALVHLEDRHGEQTRTLLVAKNFGFRATRVVDTFGGGANVSKTATFAHGRAIGGIDLAHDSLRSRYDDNPRGDGSRRLGAAFVSGEWNVSRRIRLAGGARWDGIDDSFEGTDVNDRAFSPRVGASFDLGTVTAYAQLSRAFKAPTLDQRFDQRAIAGFTISNPALTAQHAKSIEAGVRGAQWEITAYQTNVDDEIDFDVRTFRYQNIGHSRHRGIESMFRGKYFDASYAWTRVEGEDGHQLKNIAEHVARAGVNARAFVDVHVEGEYSANRWLDDANALPLDDALVVDVRVAKTFGSVTAALSANNLFDRRYAPLGFALGDTPFYYPAAGQSFAFTLSWSCRDCSSSPQRSY